MSDVPPNPYYRRETSEIFAEGPTWYLTCENPGEE
jgi:hypothetical protein